MCWFKDGASKTAEEVQLAKTFEGHFHQAICHVRQVLNERRSTEALENDSCENGRKLLTSIPR